MRATLVRRIVPTSVPTHHRPTVSQFSSLLGSKQPALLTGLIDHWPALNTWTVANNLGSLRSHAQGVLVPVEWAPKGRGYMDESKDKGKTTMLLETYLDAFVLDRIPSEDPTMIPDLTFYMAQCHLFEKLPELKDDIPGPFLEPYLTAGKGEIWPCNVWIGPAGTFTPIHRDPYHNLLTHLSPSPKTLHLYPPSTPPHTLCLARPPQHQTSLIPVSPPRLASLPEAERARWSAFEEARKGEIVVKVGKGETVLIPEGWWHCVEGVGGQGDEDGMRLSVNFWFR